MTALPKEAIESLKREHLAALATFNAQYTGYFLPVLNEEKTAIASYESCSEENFKTVVNGWAKSASSTGDKQFLIALNNYMVGRLIQRMDELARLSTTLAAINEDLNKATKTIEKLRIEKHEIEEVLKNEKENAENELRKAEDELKTFEEENKKMVTELATLRSIITTNLNELKKTVGNDQDLSSKLDGIVSDIENLHLQVQATKSTAPKKNLPQLDKRIPTFHGNNDNFDEWIYQIDKHLTVVDVPKDRIIDYIRPLLRGDALQVLRRYEKDKANLSKPIEWEGFREQLTNFFKPGDYERKLRLELEQVKHIPGRFEEFVNKFRRIANKLESIPESELVFQFTKAVNPEIGKYVIMENPTELTEAIRIAKVHSETFDKPRTVGINVVRSNYSKSHFPKKPRNKVHTYIQNGANRKGENKPNKWGQKQSWNKSAQSTETKGNELVPYKEKGSTSGIKCFKCNRTGHKAKECRVARVNNVVPVEGTDGDYVRKPRTVDVFVLYTGMQSILGTDGTVNGHQVHFAIDSGATASIISVDVVNKYKIEISESDVIVRLADNSMSKVMGITVPVTVQVGEKQTQLRLLVLDHSEYQVLLGLDWLVATGAVLNARDQILDFPGHQIQLQCQEKGEEIEEIMISGVTESVEYEGAAYWEPMTQDELEKFKVTTEEELTTTQHNKFKLAMKDMVSIFAYDLTDLEKCNVGEFTIRTLDVAPIFSHPYRRSLRANSAIDEKVQKMLRMDIIEPSKSPWSSPIVLVEKRDGSWRFCVDYRKVNSVTITEHWPLPRIDDILDGLAGSTWFSTLDLTSGYWQIKMETKSKEITAFSTPKGHYQFKVLPFGLKNAPATFMRIMHQILGDKPYVKIYLDDITIHSNTFEEHLTHIAEVAKILKATRLRVKPQKCKWLAKKVKLLGHVVSGKTVEPDHEKTAPIANRLPPRNVKQVQEFLGICGYYRKYVKGFAEMAAPLYELLKKDEKFKWSSEQERAFESLKKALTGSPILRQPRFDLNFLIYTDASGYAIGSVLAQKDEDGNEYVVAYSSRLLKGPEIHYSITEKECLALVLAVKTHDPYLICRKFTVVTDHSALIWLMNISEPTGRLARWAIYLQAYDFDIIHRAGLKHSNADTLSRPVIAGINSMRVVEQSEDSDLSPKTLDVFEDDNLLTYLRKGKMRSGITKRQAVRITAQADKYKITFEDGKETIWYRKAPNEDFKIVPHPEERYKVAERAHLLGHYQVEATLKRLKEQYYWKKMRDTVEKVIKNCIPCKTHHKSPQFDHQAIALPVTGIFDRIGIDLTFGLPETYDGYKGLMTITDYLSKYAFAYPIKSKTASEVAEKLLDYISLFGPPKVILTDQGNEFNNAMIDKLTTAFGVDHRITSAYHPRTNGQTERFNYVLIESLRKFTIREEDKRQWN